MYNAGQGWSYEDALVFQIKFARYRVTAQLFVLIVLSCMDILTTVSGMGPGDIVADPASKQLFIIDWRPAAEGGTRVWRFEPSTGQYFYYNNATHWTGTLSLSANNEVVGVSGNGG